MISLDVTVAQGGTSCSPITLPSIYQSTTSTPSHSLPLLWPQVASFPGNQGLFADNSCVVLSLLDIFLVSFPPTSSFKGEHDFYLHVVLLFSFNHLLKRPPLVQAAPQGHEQPDQVSRNPWDLSEADPFHLHLTLVASHWLNSVVLLEREKKISFTKAEPLDPASILNGFSQKSKTLHLKP